jgi:hypothetical protein
MAKAKSKRKAFNWQTSEDSWIFSVPRETSTANVGDDPIDQALLDHAAAFRRWKEVLSISSKMTPGVPGCDAMARKEGWLSDRFESASVELAGVVPTTIGGVVRLLHYVEVRNRVSAFSSGGLWPQRLAAPIGEGGAKVEMAFEAHIARNVLTALDRLLGATA